LALPVRTKPFIELAVFITNEVEVRFVVGLPTFGRRIAGQQAAEMLDELPQLVERT